MSAFVKSALTAKFEKLVANYVHYNAISVFGLMYRFMSYLVEQRHFDMLLL